MTYHFLKLNSDKTELLEIIPFHSSYSSGKCFNSIDFDGTPISPVTSAKSLGIYFDDQLTFKRQINETVKTCNYRLMNLARIASKLDKDLKLRLVQNFILSRLDYCNSVYSSVNASLIDKLQTVLNASARFVCGLYGRTWQQRASSPSTSANELLYELHFLPVHYRIIFKICLLCYKCINNIAPPYLQELLCLRQPSAYNLRIDNDFFCLAVPNKPHYKKAEAAFTHFAPTVWNSLPYSIRCNPSVESFKVALKTFLFKKAYPDSQD